MKCSLILLLQSIFEVNKNSRHVFKMKNCLLYGNCQIEPLQYILKNNSNFASNYQFIELEPVHLLTENDVEDLETKIARTDLFIYQLVSDNYQGIEQFGTDFLCNSLPSEAKKIAIPGAYFTGYHPATINLKDGEGNKITEPCDYHDVNLLYLFDRGKTVTETIAIIQEVDFYQAEYVFNNLQATLDELRRRETELDISISDFIIQNYQKQKLLHTINHPGVVLLNYLADEILELLELPRSDKIPDYEVLDFTAFPIYPSVAKALKLDFEITPQYRIKGETLSLKQAVELFFNFYRNNRELVKLNIIQHQEKYAVKVCGIQVNPTQIFNTQIPNRVNRNPDDADDLLDVIRQQTFQDLLDLAEQHSKNNRYSEAIALCQAALKIEENSIHGWRQLAYCYEAKGEINAAITASDRAISINPDEAESAIHQARLLELQGKTPEAKELYRTAISLDTEQPPWVYRHLGNVLLDEDNPADAISSYQKAIALNPDFGAQIYLSLAEAHQKLQQWQPAKNAYSKALKINPDLRVQVDNELEKIPE